MSKPNHRPVESGNSPLDFFTEFCIQQQQRIRYGRIRIHDRPFVPVDVNPFRDPELYEMEIKK